MANRRRPILLTERSSSTFNSSVCPAQWKINTTMTTIPKLSPHRRPLINCPTRTLPLSLLFRAAVVFHPVSHTLRRCHCRLVTNLPHHEIICTIKIVNVCVFFQCIIIIFVLSCNLCFFACFYIFSSALFSFFPIVLRLMPEVFDV